MSHDNKNSLKMIDDNPNELHERNPPSPMPSRIKNVVIMIPDDRVSIASDTLSHKEEAKDTAGPLPDTKQMARKTLRRNSISMPDLNTPMMAVLKNLYAENEANATDQYFEDFNRDDRNEMADDETSMACSLADRESDFEASKPCICQPETKKKVVPRVVITTSDEEEEHPHFVKNKKRATFRNKRRLSIAPLPALRLNDKTMMANELDTQSELSHQASITSVNSLASLVKEKMQHFPQLMRRRKKPKKDLNIKVFVGVLFLIIVFLVGYAYIMYQQQLLARSYFEKIKFNKRTRAFRILDNDGGNIISGKLAADLHGRPFQCLPEDSLDDGSICLEWVEMARMYLNQDIENSNDNVDCYSIYWKSLLPDWNPVDCFDVGTDLGHWYGLGLLKDLKWPLELSSFEYAPFITGNHMNQQFGNAVKRYFLNSKGAAIKVDETVPLYLSMRAGGIEEFCIKSKHDDFAFFNRKTQMPEMQYRICTATNMTVLHNEMTQKSLWDGLKEEDIHIIHTLLEEPIWQIPAQSVATLTEAALYNYTENVIEMGYLRLGHVLVSEFWQKLVGDFRLDEDRFPTLENTINILHRRGFQVTFMIQPFISTESPQFAEVVAKQLVVTERGSEGMVPALTRYKSAPSAALLDITNNRTMPWLVEKLKKIQKAYSVDSFFLDIGSGYNIPRYYEFNQTLDNPDTYKTVLINKLQASLTLIGVSGAVNIPRPPAFLSLPPVNSSWEGLKTTIVAALGYGIIGYPFIIPNPVGGDFQIEQNDNRTLTFYSMPPPPLPDIELYIRWLQLATFMPVLRFSHLPSQYKSEVVTEVAKELTAIRTKTVIPTLKKFLNDAMNEGLPLVRPLWMMDPKDVNCLTIDDEFMVGNDIIVAPIIEELTFQREVYLPQGVWKDGIDNSLRKGNRWIHNYRVPLDKIAYFIKMPDNTRF